MKKILTLLFLNLFFTQLVFADDLFTTNTRHEENAELKYTVDISYPEMINAEKFNQLVNDAVKTEVDQFKKYVKADAVHMQTLPESIQHNTFTMDFDSTIIQPNKKTIISILFNIQGFQAGRAHPYHTHQTLNYDVTKAKALTLSDLFKPHVNYLKVIAAECRKQLKEKLKDDISMLNTGTAPLPKNYKNWNLQADGLLITFEEYQVAPYVYGAQEVIVPYTALKKIMAVNSPVAICAVNTEECAEE